MVARNPLNTSDPSDGHADLFVTIPRKASALWESSRVLFDAHRELGMPITRKTEVSDAELEDVVAYLTRNRTK
jgi:hypothetical protein